MIKELKLTRRRKLLGAVVICVALITGSTLWWQMGQVAEAAILDPHPGLVGWWRFDEVDGNLAEDSSGYGNDGAIYGATWVDGKYGKALSFDGTDDYVKVPNTDSLNPPYITVLMWVKRTTDLTELQFFLNKYDFVYAIYRYPADTPNTFRVCVQVADGSFKISPSIELLDTNWHQVGVSFNGTNAFYICDSVRTSYWSGAATTLRTDTTGHLYLGSRLHTSGFMPCIIDEVRIYNRALSTAEIQENFQKGPDFSSRLLAKVPKGTTQFIVTLSWQGVESIVVTIESPYEIYTEDMVPVYQRTSYSSDSGDMLNIKRLSVSVTALSSDEEWYIVLEFDDVEDYRITVEVQR